MLSLRAIALITPPLMPLMLRAMMRRLFRHDAAIAPLIRFACGYAAAAAIIFAAAFRCFSLLTR